jgi:hypothetical protein
VNLPRGGVDECTSWSVQRNQESTMVTTGKPRRRLIAAASFFGIAMALAVTSSAQAQHVQMVAQPSAGHGQPSSGGNQSGNRYIGVLTHAFYWSGPSQSQGLPPGPPPSHGGTKPPL